MSADGAQAFTFIHEKIYAKTLHLRTAKSDASLNRKLQKVRVQDERCSACIVCAIQILVRAPLRAAPKTVASPALQLLLTILDLPFDLNRQDIVKIVLPKQQTQFRGATLDACSRPLVSRRRHCDI